MQKENFVRKLILALVLGASFAVTWYLLTDIDTGIFSGQSQLETKASDKQNTPLSPAQSDVTTEGPLAGSVEGTTAPGVDADPKTSQAPADEPYSAAEDLSDAAAQTEEPVPAVDEAQDDATKEEATDAKVVTGEIQQGDTAEQILAPFVTSDTFQEILKASKGTHPLSRIRQGQPYTVVRSDEDGSIEAFEYEIDREKKLVINRSDSGFAARVEPIEYDVETTVVEGVIDSSLFQAIASTGENPDIGIQLATIFGSEINFIKDIHKGDSFALVVEKRYRDGVFRNYGPMHAARFVNQGKAYEGFRFTDNAGAVRYFNSKGESLAKTLLKAPLSFTRVTSGYTMARKHPIYFDRRPHQGVDYGAPSGTPVKAVGDGTVTKSGWGNGFGNMVIIKHGGGLESMYSHLSGFAKNARSGAKVRQGQVIGYVGSTGVSTGPHLDFRLKQNNKYVNPTKFVAPRGNALPKNLMGSFSRHVKKMQEKLR